MNILLTGANGFLGKLIFKRIVTSGVIKTLGKSNSDFCINLGHDDIITFKEKFDVVIHVAGKAHVIPKTIKEKNSFYEVNVHGTLNLLKGFELSQWFPKQFVFISSVAVYGQTTGNNIDEDWPLLADDPYGLSKIQAEKLIQEWCKKHNVICTILRLPLLVGENPPGNLRSMIKGIDKGYYFNIAGGCAKKSMVLAEDVAKYIIKAAEIGGVYNLTDGYHPSFGELANHIAFQLSKSKPMNIPLWLAKIVAKFGDILGKKAPLNTHKLKKITSNLTFDDSKAREAFGWEPRAVLEAFEIN